MVSKGLDKRRNFERKENDIISLIGDCMIRYVPEI